MNIRRLFNINNHHYTPTYFDLIKNPTFNQRKTKRSPHECLGTAKDLFLIQEVRLPVLFSLCKLKRNSLFCRLLLLVFYLILICICGIKKKCERTLLLYLVQLELCWTVRFVAKMSLLDLISFTARKDMGFVAVASAGKCLCI